jgi:hypothetical protein
VDALKTVLHGANDQALGAEIGFPALELSLATRVLGLGLVDITSSALGGSGARGVGASRGLLAAVLLLVPPWEGGGAASRLGVGWLWVPRGAALLVAVVVPILGAILILGWVGRILGSAVLQAAFFGCVVEVSLGASVVAALASWLEGIWCCCDIAEGCWVGTDECSEEERGGNSEDGGLHDCKVCLGGKDSGFW